MASDAICGMLRQMSRPLEVLAVFLLLFLTHYCASCILPVADCDETFNFVEPIHYLLYGYGKQTWELCSKFALRSWLFLWMYAWPAVFARGVASLSSVGVYFSLRIYNGCIAALAELFFTCSVWCTFSGKMASVALLLLLSNYPIHHAAVSFLPTSFVMVCNFVVLGCWLHTQRWASSSAASSARASTSLSTAPPRHLSWFIGAALFFSVLGVVAGWPFAAPLSAFVGIDLLLRFPKLTTACASGSFLTICGAALVADAQYYCRWTLSSWNLIMYNVFGGAERGPELFGVEPWFFFWKNLMVNFHLMFVAALLAPLAVLCAPRQGPANMSVPCDAVGSGSSPNDSPALGVNDSNVSEASSLGRSPLRKASGHGHCAGSHASLLGQRHPHASVHAASAATVASHLSCRRELLSIAPFFAWLLFWMCIPHKEERFMSPAYPFMTLAATRAVCLIFFPDTEVSQCASATAKCQGRGPAVEIVAVAGAQQNDFTSGQVTRQKPPPSSCSPRARSSVGLLWWRRASGAAFLVAFCLLSCSRAMAIYHFYSGPERIFHDWYPVLTAEANRALEVKRQAVLRDNAMLGGASRSSLLPGTTAQQTQELHNNYIVCLGREWYRFPSSFFLHHRSRYQFLDTPHFHGLLPMSFKAAPASRERGFLRAPSSKAAATRGSCCCGSRNVNDLNKEIPEQYVCHPSEQCDAIFDSLSPRTYVSAAQHTAELKRLQLDSVFTRSLLNISSLNAVLNASGKPHRAVKDTYAVLDVDRTPLWCRVLYYPFGISRRCAVWRPLVLNAKS
ncbi:hypothetical protein LSCM1_07826 [Leishmania martiniquensis]|uniref:Mannosyltransferase n=1 Tax=Leishmania martiniquensis TaxID=1580590 RepID=A0A836HE24_9TRYP|nr:hypothetical protein LSCM1_07826 [Leishmania martiniquensis]